MPEPVTDKQLVCNHCGEICDQNVIRWQDKVFCCDGCRLVYQLLDKNGLCDYYNLNDKPGINQRVTVRKDKFAFLEDPEISQQLISFRDDRQTHVTFYLPQVHCSSCLYLLENLHQLEDAVVSSKVNFTRKEVYIVFNHHHFSLQQVAELLTSIGYEPYISLNDLKQERPRIKKSMIYQLGVAGFCFANIMLLSFPEYLGIDQAEKGLQGIFRILNFVLALPVFFYSAMPFYESGWKSLRHKFLNIDAPIALAIIVTFTRSVYEIISGTGPGYFDSMTGLVFFMLVGRILQDKTYQQLSFERDYTSYFPIAVSVLKDNKETPTALPAVKPGDTLLIHSEELIPADGILTKGRALIDYSFVTGESIPVSKDMGEIIYAGGRQTGGHIEMLVIKEVTQSYLTRLWSNDEFKKTATEDRHSFVHLLSRYFTYIVFTIAAAAAVYWLLRDDTRVWNVITAVLIVACPCALLLSNTFTNGNILRLLGKSRFYLRSAQTIEDIADVDHIVFDKTGTLTSTRIQDVTWEGQALDPAAERAVAALAAQSRHPLSRALVQHIGKNQLPTVQGFREVPGEGIEGFVEDTLVKLGSYAFIHKQQRRVPAAGQEVYVAFDHLPAGRFIIRNHYRDSIPALVKKLGKTYQLSVISGDQDSERENLQQLLGRKATLLFNQSPEDKLRFIRQLQQRGHKVMMIGDGLNDAGALKQSDVGVAIAEDTNNFTPASDAIIEAARLPQLARFIRFCQTNKQIVIAAFILSIVYNVIGLFFAVQGLLSPLTAAVLMPSSSISIVLITFGSTNLIAKKLRVTKS